MYFQFTFLLGRLCSERLQFPQLTMIPCLSPEPVFRSRTAISVFNRVPAASAQQPADSHNGILSVQEEQGMFEILILDINILHKHD